MNFKDERNYQKLLETLENLQLSEENQKLAEEYLDMTAPENRELLQKARRQDLSQLDRNKVGKCRDYMGHLRKRGRTEELSRFVRFVAAVSGSTAYFAFILYGWNTDSIKEFLTKEQETAIRAEGIVWNNYGLKKAAANLAQNNTEILRKAMKLCYHRHGNAETLLAAMVLYNTKAESQEKGLLKKLLTKEKPNEELKGVINCLETNLVDSIPNMFTGAEPPKAEMDELMNYVRRAESGAFPERIARIIRGRKTEEYLTLLLSGAAFLGIEHSKKCMAFLCLAAAMDAESGRTTTLDVCLDIGGYKWFLAHVEALEEALPIRKEDYVLWCLKNKAGGGLGRMIRNYPGMIKGMLSEISTENYQYLLREVADNSPKLFQEINASATGEYERKMAKELTARYTVGQQEAVSYLLGEAEIDVLYPYIPKWRDTVQYYSYDYNRKLAGLLKDKNMQQMYRRSAVLEGMCLKISHFNYMKGTYRVVDKEILKEILTLFEEEKVPAGYQLEMLGSIYDSFYQEKQKTNFLNNCVVLLCGKREWEDTFVSYAKEGTPAVRFLCIRVLDVHFKEYRDILLSCAMDGSKQVRELLSAVYGSHKEWEPEIKEMLSSRKSQERELAVSVLKQWGASSYREAFEAALSVEKSKKIKTLLEECLGMERESDAAGPANAGEKSLNDLAREILKGGKKRKVSWAYETPFPEVHRQDGTIAEEDYLTAILVAYADMGIPGVNKDAARLACALQAKELADYVNVLFGKWLDGGAEAKKKWVLYAASIHGGDAIVPVLNEQIKEWPKASRGAMAAEAVKALSVNGSSTALLLVDQIARKFKFRQVKTAAADALTYAAGQLGITREELEDRIVPNLGFDEGMELTFDYGGRCFKVLLSPALELEVYDENEKRLKNLPAPGKKDDAEKAEAASVAFKLLKKQLKTVASNQKMRLEQALSAERTWQVEKWKALFVKNPIMHQFATGLIWGLYEQGGLKATFRYMEDGSFNTVDEEEYELPGEGSIGLVHPIELSEEELAAWKEQLSDYEVTQPFEQLERPVYRLTEEEKGQKELTRFGGKLLNGLSLSGKLQGLGWYRGSVQDAGGYYTFYREDGDTGVELEFSGCFVGDENEEVTVYGAVFYQSGTVKRGSYVYDTVKKEHQRLLSEISPRYFSEIVLQLTKATASSKEQLSYPECKNS